ncbi:hypothetical protein PR202_ga08379 [Eleusine coracana subsp. coracana]|uniref:Cullin N-terminal domain-containing protein n=1 Tax=Eleusine coracana subsp. coracana TaxID=191504 RepID=A0AAV5C0F7_ELECO|nr:hypothetical protein PR202_ga08379 [Eleusine coracana subsp. coracana]
MAVQKNHYCQEMYNGFKTTLAECVRAMVLPHLTQKKSDHFFKELVRMWSNYCTTIRFVTFFSYLDRCYLEQYKLPSLNDTAATSFFGTVILEDTYAYYSKRSSEWIMHYSLPDYLAKVQETMEKETKRLAHYLCISDEDSLHFCLQAVSPPLMQTYDSYAREKNIGGELLLQTYKVNSTVEDELLARCSGLTLDGCSDNSSFNGTK